MMIKYLSSIHDGTPNSMGEIILPGAIKEGLGKQFPIFLETKSEDQTIRELIGYCAFYYKDEKRIELIAEAYFPGRTFSDSLLFGGATFLTPASHTIGDTYEDVHDNLQIRFALLSNKHSRDDVKPISTADIV